MPTTHERRLFVTVRQPERLAEELQAGMWIPTRLTFTLGERAVLGLHLPRVSRPIDVQVTIVGRRAIRPGGMLSAGVVVKPTDPNAPSMQLLRECLAETVVDFAARVQERLRHPASLSYPSESEAFDDLRAMLDDGAMVKLDGAYARGDRLALSVVVRGQLFVEVDVEVQRLHLDRRETLVAVTVLDAAARARVIGAMSAMMSSALQA